METKCQKRYREAVRILGVRQHIGYLHTERDGVFCVLASGDDRYFVFVPVNPQTRTLADFQIPMRKSSLRPDLRRALNRRPIMASSRDEEVERGRVPKRWRTAANWFLVVT